MKENACIILMGIKHCGKTTQGRLLAEKLKADFYDTDVVIKEIKGKGAREIYKEEGKEAFMRAEKEACLFIKEKVQEKKEGAIIATGGGICGNKEALDLLKELGAFVFLQAPEKIAADRIMREATVMPDKSIANLPAYIADKKPSSLEEARRLFHDFYLERTSIYSSIADICVNLANATKEVNTKRILEAVAAKGKF